MRLSTDFLTDEAMDLKTFMDLHDIPLRSAEHHDRIAEVFQRAGFVVFSICRTGYCWQAEIAKRDLSHCSAPDLRRYIRGLLGAAGIRLHRHEPIFASGSRHLLVLFENEEGIQDAGRGVCYSRLRRGVIEACREEFQLDPPDNYPREEPA